MAQASRARAAHRGVGHALPAPGARPAGRAAPGRPPRPLPDLRRGLRGERRRAGAPSRVSREAIRSRVSCWLLPDDPERRARAHAPDRRAPARAADAAAICAARGAGPNALDRGLVAEGAALVEGAVAQGPSASTSSRPRSQPSTTGRGPPMNRLAPDPRALRAPRADDREPGRDAQPGGCRSDHHGPEAGLAVLDTLDGRLDATHRVDAVRAHLLELAGDTDAA